MGLCKNKVYNTPPTTKEDMKIRISEAFAGITPAMLQNVGRSFIRRVEICVEQSGLTFENL
jgi:hypothetical protein